MGPSTAVPAPRTIELCLPQPAAQLQPVQHGEEQEDVTT